MNEDYNEDRYSEENLLESNFPNLNKNSSQFQEKLEVLELLSIARQSVTNQKHHIHILCQENIRYSKNRILKLI